MSAHCTAGCPLKGNNDSVTWRTSCISFRCIFFPAHFSWCKKSVDLISAQHTQICMNTSTWSVYLSTAHASLPALIESACPSCFDLIILLSGCSLTHIIILQTGAYGITVPSITAYSMVHILWITGCHYILMHLIENIQSVRASHVDSSLCSQRRMLAIYMPINVHMLQKYANTDRRTRRRKSAGATQTDLWVIMGYEYVCVHIMRFTNCCKCPVWDFVQAVWCLNMFHWPSLHLQNVSLGVFICPHPTGRITKYSNFLLTSGLWQILPWILSSK